MGGGGLGGLKGYVGRKLGIIPHTVWWDFGSEWAKLADMPCLPGMPERLIMDMRGLRRATAEATRLLKPRFPLNAVMVQMADVGADGAAQTVLEGHWPSDTSINELAKALHDLATVSDMTVLHLQKLRSLDEIDPVEAVAIERALLAAKEHMRSALAIALKCSYAIETSPADQIFFERIPGAPPKRIDNLSADLPGAPGGPYREGRYVRRMPPHYYF
mmetsp:Transcript_69393/g.166382  ORF Transcript_69393/g.166382 Transcript_69393/m.166382 type:complete len:217 (+) Transcript_69393:116-766(+)